VTRPREGDAVEHWDQNTEVDMKHCHPPTKFLNLLRQEDKKNPLITRGTYIPRSLYMLHGVERKKRDDTVNLHELFTKHRVNTDKEKLVQVQ